MPIRVLEPGLATSIQDRGRFGYYHLGIPPSGAMDQYSLLAANLLVANAEDAAGLEITYLGPKLEFTEAALVAVTGAELQPRFGGETRPLWESFPVSAGDVLSFGFLKAGARAYLAVAGGIDVPVSLGSRSTYEIGSLGGVGGRGIQAGDELPIGASNGAAAGRSVPRALRPELSLEQEIRVVMGLYDHLLTEEARRDFLATVWTLGPEANRMGLRYRGKPLAWRPREPAFGAGSDPSNIVDAPYPIGSIQVPAGVEPILLHREAVSGGGYAMICTVISADMDAVGQSQPNARTRFVGVDIDGALEARKAHRARREELRSALA